MSPQIVLREKIYVPVDDLDDFVEVLDAHFLIDLFNDDGCEDCEEYDNRPSDVCQECAHYLARKKLYNTKTVDDQVYVGLPYGKKVIIPRIIPHASMLPIKDMRPLIRFKSKLAFTGELREHQEEAVDKLASLEESGKLRGVLRAPARSGKTVCGVALICRLGLRTLVLANEQSLCSQFYNTFVGSKTQPGLTNAKALGAKGNPVVIVARKLEDYFKGDVVISTYQQFISDVGKEKLKEVAQSFSGLIVDESHRSAADTFLKVVSTFNTRFKLGLTATTGRKDGMHILSEYVLGGVLHRMKVPTMRPRVVVHETGIFPKKDMSSWTNYCRWLERQDERTEMIVDQVIEDVKAGRFVVIPCTLTSQMSELLRRINNAADRKIAEMVTGDAKSKKNRDVILDRCRSGKTKVLIGTRSIIGTGTNVPRWDTLYWIQPLSNPPNWVQEYSRILTPVEGKNPLIRMFLDGSGQTRGCLRTCLFKTEGDNPPLSKHAMIDAGTWNVINRYISKRKLEGPVRVKGSKLLGNGRVSMG